MDPDETLKKLRTDVDRYMRFGESLSDDELVDMLDDIADRFLSLDSWISGGGFLPRAWV